MAKPIITLNGLKIVIMLGMLVIILCGIRFAAEIIVPFILALFIAVILNPLVQHMVRWRVPRVLAVSILMTIIVMAMVLLLAYLGSALNELTRTLPQYRNSIMTPLQALEPLLQRVGIDVSVDQLAHYIDPNAAMTLLTNLLTQLSNAMSSIFLLLLTVLFMLLEVPQLPGKFQQMMARPVEGILRQMKRHIFPHVPEEALQILKRFWKRLSGRAVCIWYRPLHTPMPEKSSRSAHRDSLSKKNTQKTELKWKRMCRKRCIRSFNSSCFATKSLRKGEMRKSLNQRFSHNRIVPR